MKKNKTICLDEQIMKRLDDEDNASGLIEKLLRAYFHEEETKTLSKEKLLEIMEVKKQEIQRGIELQTKEIERIEKQIKHVEQKELTEEEIKNRNKRKMLLRLEGIYKTFKEDGLSLTADEVMDYVDKFDTGRTTYFEYLKQKQKEARA
jgi:hypothetical protein